ncbi:LAMI_0E07756g1_1 [Lachancea mirantina]|uniref:LAMI_0E07756g1_1 n=1 Tax=Lachancea mirantina TaxID=1230905 RepID=A0A1G4JMM6_9SACH|nr:LAMI_0E07756g1_1 [Lachancea mirantina]
MGRRKIAIEPILDERNRGVTFIKRKAGLFKKAHELAVLCQVDVALIILGTNNTFYEFSSVDTADLIKHYQNDALSHDVKGPADYGNFKKKDKVVLHDTGRRRSNTAAAAVNRAHSLSDFKQDDEGDPDDEEDDDSGNDNDEVERNVKRPRSQNSPQFNPLQQQVQRQFHNLYAVASHQDHRIPQSTPALTVSQRALSHTGGSSNVYARSASNAGGRSSSIPASIEAGDRSTLTANQSTAQSSASRGPRSVQSTSALHNSTPSTPLTAQQELGSGRNPSARPVLRVQIPSTSGTSIKSEPSSGSPIGNVVSAGASGSQFQRSNGGRIELPRPSRSKNGTPSSAHASPLYPSHPAAYEKNDKSGQLGHPLTTSVAPSGVHNPANGFLFNGLPSAIAASPSIQQYFATPIQPTPQGMGPGSGGHGLNPAAGSGGPLPPAFSMHRQLHNLQHQSQVQQLGQSTGANHVEGGIAGAGTGSLPSKFAQDLVVPSPGVSMGMLHDWSFSRLSTSQAPGGQSANNGSGIGDTTNPNPAGQSMNNGNSGFTPYITVNQTPLSSRYFNFGDMSDTNKDKKTKARACLTNCLKKLYRNFACQGNQNRSRLLGLANSSYLVRLAHSSALQENLRAANTVETYSALFVTSS